MPAPSTPRTLVHVLRQRASQFPNKPWLIFDDRVLTYGEAEILSNRIANGMLAQGLKAGETLLVMLPDGLDLVLSWLASANVGVVEVPLNTAYKGDILGHVIRDSRAQTMLIAQEWLDRLAGIEGSLGNLQRCFVKAGTGEMLAGSERVAVQPLETLLSGDDRPLDRETHPSGLKAIMYTSGTTGPSKGVMVAHAHAYEYANGCASMIAVDEDDVYYTAGLPLFHIAGRWGVLYGALIKGATAVVPRHFSARNFWDDIRRHKATATYSLGAMANFLQRQPATAQDREHTLRRMLMCPLLPDLDAFVQRFGVEVATAYGSTEVNAPLALPLGSRIPNQHIVGMVRSELFDVAIIGENDEKLPAGAHGQIAVRPKLPGVTMLGYWHQPEATVAMWRNLWLHSGDAGYCDAEGRFYFTDRLRDTIRRRGENISSMEVEGIVSQHPAVLECAVFPVRSEHTEEEVMTAIVLRPGAAADPVGLIAFLEPRMPRFMVPRYIEIVLELPKTPTGKVRKHLLRDRGVSPATFDRETC